MAQKESLHGYVSEIDAFLRELDQLPGAHDSPARIAEEKKYERVHRLRDHDQPRKDNKIWKGF